MPKTARAATRAKSAGDRRGLVGFIPQLLGFIILPLTVLLVGITLGSSALHENAMRDMAGDQDLRTVRATAQTLASLIEQRAVSLRGLSALAAAGIQLKDLAQTSPDLTGGFDGGVAAVSASGEFLTATPDFTFTQEQVLRLVGEVSQAQPALEIPPARVEVHPQTGDPYLMMATPLASGDILLAAASVSSLARPVLSSLVGGHDIAITLANDEGLVLYQVGEASLHGLIEAQRGESGVTYMPVGRDEHVVAFSPVAPYQWSLVIEQPWSALTSPLLRVTQALPLALIPALLLALLGLWFGVRQVIQPLQALRQQAASLAQSRVGLQDPPLESVGGIAEIQDLQDALQDMAGRMRASQENLRSYLGAVTASQEDERKRLAREIHDDTLQAIIALNQRVQLAQRALDGHPAAASLDETRELVEKTIADLRRLTRALRPAYLDALGLPAALQALAADTGQAAGIEVSFACSGQEKRLSPDVEQALYRMVQEALSNVTRHSGAAYAGLELAYYSSGMTLTIRDDGRGFRPPDNPGEFAQAGHFGLLGLYERADLIGAQLEIDSTPGRGTEVQIKVEELKGG